jgi:energy-coupling factor transporter ATP-binding protein EcfA2
MKISRVTVKNWRSIKHIDFYPSDMTVLIGPNNAGKTNILSALNLLIGDRWPMPGNLADADFYQGDRTRPINIRLDFKGAPYGRLKFDSGAAQYNLKAYDHYGNQVRGVGNPDTSAHLVGREGEIEILSRAWDLVTRGEADRPYALTITGIGDAGRSLFTQPSRIAFCISLQCSGSP